MKKHEAKQLLENAPKEFPRGTVFCPLIKENCKEQCECLEKPKVFSDDRGAIKNNQPVWAKDYYFKNWRCTSLILKGD